MSKELEKCWLDLVLFSGAQKPLDLTERSLLNWAKPGANNPGRKNRALLFEILQKARTGDLSSLDNFVIKVGDKTIKLCNLQQFQRLKKFEKTRNTTSREGIFAWIDFTLGSNKVTNYLKMHAKDSLIEDLNIQIEMYFDYENELYNKEKVLRERYDTDCSRIRQMRDALDTPKFTKHNQMLDHIDDYSRLVLSPLSKAIKGTSETRRVLKQYYTDLIGNAVARTEGIKTEVLHLPPLSQIDEILTLIPDTSDDIGFINKKFEASVKQTELKLEKYMNEISKACGHEVNLDMMPQTDNLQLGHRYHVQVIANSGTGNIKAVNSFNPENTFQ